MQCKCRIDPIYPLAHGMNRINATLSRLKGGHRNDFGSSMYVRLLVCMRCKYLHTYIPTVSTYISEQYCLNFSASSRNPSPVSTKQEAALALSYEIAVGLVETDPKKRGRKEFRWQMVRMGCDHSLPSSARNEIQAKPTLEPPHAGSSRDDGNKWTTDLLNNRGSLCASDKICGLGCLTSMISLVGNSTYVCTQGCFLRPPPGK